MAAKPPVVYYRAAAAHVAPPGPEEAASEDASAAPSPARAVLKAGHVKQITNFFQNMTVAEGAMTRPRSRLSHGSGVAANKENVVHEDDCDSPLLGKVR